MQRRWNRNGRERKTKAKDKKSTKKEKDTRPIIYVQRLSDREYFAEAVIVGGIPAFIVRNKDAIFTTDKIELEDKIVKPLPVMAYLNKPYSFKIDEVERVIEIAKKETLDTLYRKVKSIWKKYVDADDFHISICAADTIFTYYQDKLGLVHYLFFVGGLVPVNQIVWKYSDFLLIEIGQVATLLRPISTSF